MSRENSPDSSTTDSDGGEPAPGKDGLIGDPNCPHCGGLGYLRSSAELGTPDFGKIVDCVCRRSSVDQQVRERLYSLSRLHELRSLTFETFQTRGQIGLGPFQSDSIERAYNHARQFAQSHEGWLIFQGKFGCGKTHLAAAIANTAGELGVPALFLTVPDLLDSLRYAYNDPDATFESRFEEVRQAPLLVLDDFGTQNATEWAEEKLFQILNYRYVNRLPLVITTNLALDDIEPRLRSRIEDPDLVTRVQIVAPDYRRPADDTGHHELSSLQYLANRSFGNFEDRRRENLAAEDVRSLTKAFQAAQRFAEEPEGWMVFMGTYGSGKTHLAAAIANYRAGLGYPPLFIMVPDLLDHLRSTFAPDSRVRYDRLFDEIKTTPLLILDDFGGQSTTAWVREKLNQLFNHRYIAELPTIITTAASMEDLHRSEPRIASRMLDTRLCSLNAITAPPFRGL